jgi:hypothetical protein
MISICLISGITWVSITCKPHASFTGSLLTSSFCRSSVLVSGNYFDQTGAYPDDKTRIFTFQNLATPDQPGSFCSPPDLSSSDATAYSQLSSLVKPSSALHGEPVNLTSNVFQTFAYYISTRTDSVEGGLVEDCAKFEGQSMPASFDTADNVLAYVTQNAGQVGRNTP